MQQGGRGGDEDEGGGGRGGRGRAAPTAQARALGGEKDRGRAWGPEPVGSKMKFAG